MNKIKINSFTVVKITTVAVCIAMAVLRIFIILNNVSEDSALNVAYQLEKNFATNAYTVAVIVLMVAFMYIGAIYSKRMRSELDYQSGKSVFASSLAGFVLVAGGIYYLYSRFAGKITFDNMFMTVSVLMLLSGVYFIVSAANLTDPTSRLNTAFAFAPVLFCLVRLVMMFVETNYSQQLASNTYLLISLAAVMLFFVNEVKFTMKTPFMMFYWFFGATSSLFLLVYSVPQLVLAFMGKRDMNEYSLFSVADIAIAVYIIIRICSITVTDSSKLVKTEE